MQNRKQLDDLEYGDVVELDLGQTLVRGNYLSMDRSPDGKWYMRLKNAKGQEENVETSDIKRITRKY
jgi:hypothetical protein